MKFSYKGFDKAGKPAQSDIEARDVADAREMLRRQGLYVLSIKESDGEKSATAVVGAPRFGQGRKLRNVAMFMRQLHVLISTGTPLVESLSALERQTQDPYWRTVVAGVRGKVEDGVSLSVAMGHFPDQFNAICRGLIAAGESGGNLDVMLERLAELTRKQVYVRSAVIGALVYPSLLVVVSIGVLITLLTFVLPRFTMLFKSLDTALPPTTQMLMSLSEFVRDYWWIVILAAAGSGTSLWFWLKTESGKRAISTASLKIPRLSALTRNFATARIMRLLGILLQGKVSLIESLQLTRQSITNHHYVDLMTRATDAVTRGESLASVFSDSTLVNSSVYEAMRSGDKSGQMGQLLSTVADFLDEENDVTLRSLTSIMEPLILIVLGVMVGFIAISMFMPLFDLTAATRGGN